MLQVEQKDLPLRPRWNKTRMDRQWRLMVCSEPEATWCRNILLTTKFDLTEANIPITLPVNICESTHIHTLPLDYRHDLWYPLKFPLWGYYSTCSYQQFDSRLRGAKKICPNFKVTLIFHLIRYLIEYTSIEYYSSFSSHRLVTVSLSEPSSVGSPWCASSVCSFPQFQTDFAHLLSCRNYRTMHDLYCPSPFWCHPIVRPSLMIN